MREPRLSCGGGWCSSLIHYVGDVGGIHQSIEDRGARFIALGFRVVWRKRCSG